MTPSNLFDQPGPVVSRHVFVDHDGGNRPRAYHRQRAFRIRGLTGWEAFFPEPLVQQLPNVAFVVDDEDLAHVDLDFFRAALAYHRRKRLVDDGRAGAGDDKLT